MKYLLDTNICIYIIKQRPATVQTRFSSLHVGDVGISTITLSELQYGAEKSSFPDRNKQTLAQFLLLLELLDYSQDAAREYGKIRAYLEKRGQLIGSLDLLIAAHAKAANLILVTNNIKEFSRVPELLIENWI